MFAGTSATSSTSSTVIIIIVVIVDITSIVRDTINSVLTLAVTHIITITIYAFDYGSKVIRMAIRGYRKT